jgi:hypothetical protein
MADLPIIDLDDDDGGTGSGIFGGGWHHSPSKLKEHEALIAHLSPEEQEKVRRGHRPFQLPLEPIWKP